MAKEANLKLLLDVAPFTQSIASLKPKIRDLGNEGRKLGPAFSAGGKEALASMKGALAETGAMLKGHLATAATLGGALGFGSMVKGAVELRSKFQDFEFQVNKTGKATVAWADMMERAREVAAATGQSTNNIGTAMQALFADTGDLEFTSDAIEAIGVAATASGKPVEQLADLAGLLKEKFGATAETLPDMMAVFLEKTDAGAISLDDLNARFGLLAGEASAAGLGGAAGLSSLLGVLDMLDDRIGEKSVPGMKKLLQTLKVGSADLKEISKKSGLKFTADESAVDKLRKIVSSDKGRKVMVEKLGGDLRVVFDELARPFNEAAAQAKTEKKSAKDQRQAGIEAFNAAMGEAGKTTLQWKSVLKAAEDRVENDPAKKLQLAIDKMQAAFTRPEMLDAIDTLADNLPAFADGLAKVLKFILKSPLTAGTLLVGGKMAMAGAQGFATGTIQKLFEEGGKAVGAGADKGIQRGATTFLDSIGNAKQWAQAGAIIGAAMTAYEVGKEVIGSEIGDHFSKLEKLSDVEAEASSMMKHGVGSDAERKAAADELRKRINSMEKEGGPNVTSRLFASASNLVDPSVKRAETEWYEQLNRARAVLAELEGQVKVKEASDKFATSLANANAAAEKLAGTMNKVEPPPGTPGGTSKGPPKPGNPGGGAGHAPVPG